MSVILVAFPSAPKVSQEAIDKVSLILAAAMTRQAVKLHKMIFVLWDTGYSWVAT